MATSLSAKNNISMYTLTAACAAVANILTLPENDEVMVVGTVYKDMKLKPSILDEYVKVCVSGTGQCQMYVSHSLLLQDLHQNEVKCQAATTVCLVG